MEVEHPQPPSNDYSAGARIMPCVSCGNKAKQSGTVYIGTKVPNSGDGLDAVYTYREENKGICADCVHSYQSGPVGFIFYFVLQLGWLSVAQQGLMSPVGSIGAALAILGLFRLIQKSLNEVAYRRSETSDAVSSPHEASDAVCAVLKKDASFTNQDIRSLRDHELHGG